MWSRQGSAKHRDDVDNASRRLVWAYDKFVNSEAGSPEEEVALRRERDVLRAELEKHLGRYVVEQLLREQQATFDVRAVDSSYHLIISDDTIDSPFKVSAEMVKTVQKHVHDSGEEEKARAVFDWMQEHIPYDYDYLHGKTRRKYQDAKEVIDRKTGVCGEQAFLYIAMARSVGLKSGYASVSVDCFGDHVQHGCASVELERMVLVDTAYHQFDVRHKKFRVLNDREIAELYQQWGNA